MKRWLLNARIVWLMLLAGATLSLTGCTSMDSELSARPWNAPQNWENGLPSAMTEGR